MSVSVEMSLGMEFDAIAAISVSTVVGRVGSEGAATNGGGGAGVSVVEYLIGWTWLGAVAASHLAVAVRMRTRWLPDVSRPAAWLAVSVLTFLSIIALGQGLGAVGLLAWWPLLVVSILAAAAVEIWARRSGLATPRWRALERTGTVGDAGVDLTPWERRSEIGIVRWCGERAEAAVATGVTAAVGWQWTTHLADAYDRGMVQADNLWYHGPFVARFLQTGGFGDLGTLGYPEARYYPMNSQLLQTVMVVPFERDLLVPLTNHMFAGLWVLAAYVIGRRSRAGALAITLSAVVASLPLVASTQPGQMYNDIIAGALILTAVALLGEGGDRVGVAAVAGASAGAAIGTKLSVVGVVGPLGVIVAAVLVGTRRRAAAASWSIALAATGVFWFVRNQILAGSPTPYIDLRLGPLELAGSVEPISGDNLLATLGRLDEFGQYYLDSLRVSFGPLWSVVVVGAVAGCVAVLARRHAWPARVGAAAALVGVAVFPLMPVTGGIPFVNNLRYGVPALMVAAVMCAVAVAPWRWARLGVGAAAAAVIAGNLASSQRARVPAWPGHPHWGAVAAAVVLVIAWRWSRSETARRRADRRDVGDGVTGDEAQAPRHTAADRPLPRRPVRRRRRLGVIGAIAGVVVAGGWGVQRHYLEHRYGGDGGLEEDALHRPFVDISGASVQVLGTVESYPMFGPDLSNNVTVWSEHLALDAPPSPACEFWRSEIDADQGYIAVVDGWPLRAITPDERDAWFGSDPAVRTVVEEGPVTIYRHDAPLDESHC